MDRAYERMREACHNKDETQIIKLLYDECRMKLLLCERGTSELLILELWKKIKEEIIKSIVYNINYPLMEHRKIIKGEIISFYDYISLLHIVEHYGTVIYFGHRRGKQYPAVKLNIVDVGGEFMLLYGKQYSDVKTMVERICRERGLKLKYTTASIYPWIYMHMKLNRRYISLLRLMMEIFNKMIAKIKIVSVQGGIIEIDYSEDINKVKKELRSNGIHMTIKYGNPIIDEKYRTQRAA